MTIIEVSEKTSPDIDYNLEAVPPITPDPFFKGNKGYDNNEMTLRLKDMEDKAKIDENSESIGTEPQGHIAQKAQKSSSKSPELPTENSGHTKFKVEPSSMEWSH